jgi:hypothetical protein
MLEPTRRLSPAESTYCRYCQSEACYRVTRHGWQDFFFRLMAMYPWRCSKCGSRFYRRKRAGG